MPNLLTLIPLAEGFNSALIAQQVAGALDLMGLAIGIWTIWSSISLPLGGNLHRAFRLIGLGALAFAASHLIESLIVGLQLMSAGANLLLTQGTVLISMVLFIPGLAGLADVLPTLPSSGRVAPTPRFWPIAVTVVVMIGAFSFILYGFSPQAEVAAFFGLDGSITITAGLCILLLARARIGGVVGHSLWLAMLGLLIFSLAHPLQAWLYDETSLSGDTLAILHRLIIMPSLLLFAVSMTGLARKLSASFYIESAHTKLLPTARLADEEEEERRAELDRLGARARALRHNKRKPADNASDASKPLLALRQRLGRDS
ncbi:MAG TPA: hypothetical protein VH599_21005 [Ktedonobacterales bacterium]|jgi:hypothetical protein